MKIVFFATILWSIIEICLAKRNASRDAGSIPGDCKEVLNRGFKDSSVYNIRPLNYRFAFDVFCDMETDGGGWTVLQRRGQYGNAVDYFYRFWHQYKMGFGDLKKEFWLGNDKLSALSKHTNYILRIDLKDVEGEKRYATYGEFWVQEEGDQYKLHVSSYSGNAGDSFGYHNLMKFSTKEQDNDLSLVNCAYDRKGGWWYKACTDSNLNGLNLKGPVKTDNGITWYTWKGYYYSLLEVEMKIRPKN